MHLIGKRARFLWSENGPKLERNFHRSFQNEMAHYSSNFENKWQIKIAIGKDWGFTSIFGIPKSFARRKPELARKKARAKTLPHYLTPLTKPLGAVSYPKWRQKTPKWSVS